MGFRKKDPVFLKPILAQESGTICFVLLYLYQSDPIHGSLMTWYFSVTTT